MKKVITGNKATAYGVKVCRPKVIAAYPITPQTTIVEYIADFIADGSLESKFVKVESEHSAMAACIAAQNTGVRTFTATSAHGLALMHEMLHWAAAARTPVVMVNANRAMGPPWSIWADHLDSISQRDTGWIQTYCENSQEILDTIIMSYKIAENRKVMLPALLNEDAFYLTHTAEAVDIPDQELVDEFLPDFEPRYKIDTEEPFGFGSLVMPDNYYEFRYNIARAMEASKELTREAVQEFAELFGRDYHGLIEEYRTDDAEFILMGMGTLVSTARDAIDELRDEGHKVGLVKVRSFRPFPLEEMRDLASRIKSIAIMERVYAFGNRGPLFNEVCGAVYNSGHRPFLKNYIIGIGGRDVRVQDVKNVYLDLLKETEGADDGIPEEELNWYGLVGPGGD